ncbi:MAG: ABC-F family ATP-binding cassette domain-containing protein [Pseudomonadota bacterium]|nr:ABC-F family ATP-binding cassette domain-containing protein [Pseudomonadota bacterium]
MLSGHVTPRAMLQIDNLSYRIGPRVLLDNATAAVSVGHRVGLVGRNGTGKTTLLKLIMGELDADSGSISVPSRWKTGITRQEAPGGTGSLVDAVLAADSELKELSAEAETATDPDRIARIHERLTEKEAHSARSRAARILAGLGFDETAQQRRLNEFSGGWRMRVMLASLLFTKPDLLLLDEPTNHLDLESALWLEEYLCRYDGTILIVSHDRGLLNRVAQEVLHLENTRLTLYRGGYDRFETTRRMRLEQNERARVRQETQRAHIQKFVDRFRYKATKAKQAQSRIKMLERMEPIPEFSDGPPVTFNFPDPNPPLSPPLCSILNAAVGYNGSPVLKNLSLRLEDDDRIALIGANGNGKSTLMRLLAGRLRELSGTVTVAPKLRVGYFAQHQADELDLEATPAIELGRRRPIDNDEKIRSQLGRFGFSQERADTRIASLSGGEKARLLFALMTCDAPHVLLLDEPTNHLDVDSRQALVQAINGFSGAVVIVSHDPHVLELTAERFWLVANGGVRTYDGDLAEYRALLLGNEKKVCEETSPAVPSISDAGPIDKRDQRRKAAEKRQALAPLRKQVTRIERNVAKLQAEKEEIEQKMADPALYGGDTNMVVTLQKDLAWISQKLVQAEEDWLAAQHELEASEGVGQNEDGNTP